MAKAIIGIDVGGTFTDIAVLEDGQLRVHKLPSTPQDPSIGILAGVKEAFPEHAGGPATTESGPATGHRSLATDAEFVHGSTVATNALLEGKGGRTALVTTMGFEDVLEIGRQNRSDLYDFNLERPPALAPWELRFGVPERVDHHGEIIEDLRASNAALEPLRGQRRTVQIADQQGESVLLEGTSPIEQQRELIWLVTTKRDKEFFYAIFVSPENEFNQLKPGYEEVLKSIAFQ